MKTHLKIRVELLASVRADLHRAHPFAHERAGFTFASLARPGPVGP